jgi:acetoin utilization protein AcuA
MARKRVDAAVNSQDEQIQYQWCHTQDHLENLTLSAEFETGLRSRSIFTRKETLDRILGHGGKLSLAVADKGTIIGFSSLDYPDPAERWAGIGQSIVMELCAVEVLPAFRNQGIATRLLSLLFTCPELEHKIIYLVSYRWIWDLSRTGLSADSYREMLIRLYLRYGFEQAATNEPNVCLESGNIFMVRMGKHVSEQNREAFKWLRFGLKM